MLRYMKEFAEHTDIYVTAWKVVIYGGFMGCLCSIFSKWDKWTKAVPSPVSLNPVVWSLYNLKFRKNIEISR